MSVRSNPCDIPTGGPDHVPRDARYRKGCDASPGIDGRDAGLVEHYGLGRIPEDDRSVSAKLLAELYRRLFEHFGSQHWWPGETAVEIMAGAVLTQNTNWRNVERALTNLKGAGILSVNGMADARPGKMSGLIRPAGYFRVKAQRLSNLFRWVRDEFGSSIDHMRAQEIYVLRNRMLSEVSGVGPETADSILLYAFGRPVFVVDAYTRRVLSRHGLNEAGKAPYELVREFFEVSLPAAPSLFNEFHALFVAVGKNYCRRTSPLCGECPARGFSFKDCRLPSSGTEKGRDNRKQPLRKQR